MKRLVYFIPVLAALIGGGACTPNDAESYMTVSPEEVSIDAAEQSFDLTIAANVTYRVNPQETWITVSQKASNGEETVFSVAVEANEDAAERIGTINIIGDDVTPKKVTITQAGTGTGEGEGGNQGGEGEGGGGDTPDPEPPVTYLPVGVIAQWSLGDDKEVNANTFATEEAKPAEGNGGAYANASVGTGKIEFYYAAETSSNIIDSYKGTSRDVGKNGDLYVKGGMVGDYWLVTVSSDSPIKAGSKLKFTFSFGLGNTTTEKWLLEYSCDGGEFTPVEKTTTGTDSWTKLFSTGEDATGSMEVTYNYIVKNKYQLSEKEFTVAADTKEIKIRLKAAGCLATFSKTPTQKVDCLNNSLESRFSPTAKFKEDGTAISPEIATQPVIVEITSVPAE